VFVVEREEAIKYTPSKKKIRICVGDVNKKK